MTLTVPEGMPSWLPVALLAPAILYLLVFLAMPFAVFGLKRRLALLDARLDELQGEVRQLSLRLPESIANHDGGAAPRPAVPPVPPLRTAERARRPAEKSGRAEPRLDWPR